MFFDSHVHFDAIEGPLGIDATVARAQAAGVGRMMAVGDDEATNAFAIEAARRFPNMVAAAIGYGRDNAAQFANRAASRGVSQVIESEALSAEKKGVRISAIGEIGLDYHHGAQTSKAQIALFREQLRLAKRLGLPVILHTREADADTLRELRDCAETEGEFAGVVHCFTGGADFARALLNLGFHISFSGIVTFRQASELRKIVPLIPGDRLLIETDAPYLAPEPHRGKRCEPMFLPLTAEAIAQVRGCSIEQIAATTSANALKFFRLELNDPD